MKYAVLVNNRDNVPVKYNDRLIVVNRLNCRDVYSQYFRVDGQLILFFMSDVDMSVFLKFFEEYTGDLLCFISGFASAVVLSRFNKVVNKRRYVREEFPVVGELAGLVNMIKGCISHA